MKLIIASLLAIFAIGIGAKNEGAYYVKLHLTPETRRCIILTEENIKKYRGFTDDGPDAIKIRTKDAISPISDSNLLIEDKSQIVEIFGRKSESVTKELETMCKGIEHVPPMSQKEKEILAPEVVKLVDGGPQSNRIDVVFMGDGYTLEARDQFFSDMERLIDDMFNGETFKSYLPVFNIWAIYVESVDSGIGYNGAINTPFRLYRQQGQLRGIFTGNAQFARQTCQLTGTSGCDYPSLIGNDDFYGGLGGEFVISTKSERTGTVVLRHEMGHNFVDVGEEYDNGQVYRGVNSASSLANVAKWGHWLTTGEIREERAMYRILDYPWVDLSAGSKTYLFNSDGQYDRWYCLVSVSAAGEEDSLEFLMDGEVLPWASSGYEDREFYSWNSDSGFTSGQHNFTVRTKTTPTHPQIDRMLCSVTCHEFGSEDEFVADNDHVGAYATWDIGGRKTYRPTNAGCLMRNMTSESFCSPCREGMWYEFFERISLIDDVEILQLHPDGSATVQLNTIQLGQLRPEDNQVEGESLNIRWFHNGVEEESLNDLFEVTLAEGAWRVEAEFITPEVRHDPNGLLKDFITFNV